MGKLEKRIEVHVNKLVSGEFHSYHDMVRAAKKMHSQFGGESSLVRGCRWGEN